jgi:hypothetical protein
MVLLLDERPAEQAGLQRSLVDLGAIETGLHLLDQEDVGAWPAPSFRATTSASAVALERATEPDSTPRLPPARVDDGFSI